MNLTTRHKGMMLAVQHERNGKRIVRSMTVKPGEVIEDYPRRSMPLPKFGEEVVVRNLTDGAEYPGVVTAVNTTLWVYSVRVGEEEGE